MRWIMGFLASLAGTTAFGAMLTADLQDAGHATIALDSPVDDAHFANPAGYFPPEPPAARVVRRIVIENIGETPIYNPDVRINGSPLLPVDDPLDALGATDRNDLLGLFARWCDRAIHATTDLEANENPFAVLYVFGAGFCGDDSRAFAAITTALGAEIHFARLNGHSVTEHRFGGDWMLLDGDQNLFYLGWDNRKPVSEDDILADPLLALRTQVFGRNSSWDLAAAWQNTSRFEFVDHAREQKRFRLKHPPTLQNWKLLPGEKVVVDLVQKPDRILAASEDLRTNNALREVACVVQFQHARKGGEKLALPYPSLGEAGGEPVYEVEVGGATLIECQAARAQFPTLHTGTNILESKTPGSLRITMDCNFPVLDPTPAPGMRISLPHIYIDAKNADRMWWQISADEKFRLVAPNLDRVKDYAPELALRAIDETFLSNGRYYARAKVRCGGVWSDWSRSTSFIVKKPGQPRIEAIEGADGDQMQIRWNPCDGEMLIFGSDRLDFLPEVYGDVEVTRMNNGAIVESRLNHNLLATAPAREGSVFVPTCACYRLVVRASGSLSVPSPLARSKMSARVLQNRHEKAVGALTGQDNALEMDAP